MDRSRKDPFYFQQKVFDYLIKNGKETAFGQEHRFGSIGSFEEFQKRVPIREYDALKPYIDRVRSGEDYVLWNQKVKWFAKSSGTSSDKSKFIPITHANLWWCHYAGFWKMIATYINTYPDSKFFSGKSLTLGGSVQLDELSDKGAINGDLSAVLLKKSPLLAELKRVPKRKTALVPDFEQKIKLICEECCNENVTNFSGVPSWNLVLLRKILEYRNADNILDVWPNLELFMHGGTSFEPYRSQFRRIIPSNSMHYLENYNASEGYFAFQDVEDDNSMLLTLDNGVFYEFIPLDSFQKVMEGDYDDVYNVEGVKLGEQYAMVISTNGGLWRYLIGDCVEFTSLAPHKIRITGRTQLYINAFGEELMISNAEKALVEACKRTGIVISDYSVAPIFMDDDRKGAHEWVIEFPGYRRGEPSPAFELIDSFAEILDRAICVQNSDYEAKRTGSATMSRLKITPVPEGTFYGWMEKRGKIGGQNKVPRLSNDRRYIEELKSFSV